ncbi:MAG TPA: hypothetical protein VGA36_06880 [Nitriliruptorales bacterium]
MLDFMETLTADAIGLARTVVVLIAIVSVSSVWWRTRALVPVLGSILVAGIALWAVSPGGLSWVQERVGDDSSRVTSSAPALPQAEETVAEPEQVVAALGRAPGAGGRG